MKPIDQDQFGDGNGNCYSACIASILERPLEDLREFHRLYIAYWKPASQGNHDFAKRAAFHAELLDRFGVWAVTLTASDESIRERLVPCGWSIADGPASRGVLHSCVARDGEIVHDPHPSRAGLLEIQSYEILVPVRPGV